MRESRNIYRDDVVRWKPYQKQTVLRGCFSPSYTRDETRTVSDCKLRTMNGRDGKAKRAKHTLIRRKYPRWNLRVGNSKNCIAIRTFCSAHCDLFLTYLFTNNFRWRSKYQCKPEHLEAPHQSISNDLITWLTIVNKYRTVGEKILLWF